MTDNIYIRVTKILNFVIQKKLKFSNIFVLFLLGWSSFIIPMSINAQANTYISIEQFARVSDSSNVTDSITLDKAIDLALSNNHEVLAATSSVDIAIERRRYVIGTILPSVKLQGDYSHYLDPQKLIGSRSPGENSIFSDDILSGAISLTIPIFTGGRLNNQLHQASLNRDAAKFQLYQTKEKLIYMIRSVFYSILLQKQVVLSLKFSQDALDQHLKRVLELITSQKAAKVDRLRTEVRIADISQQLVSEKNILSIQKRLLKNLIGTKNTDDFVVVGNLVVDSSTYLELDEYLQIAYKNRKDYLAAKSETQAMHKNINIAQASYWPTVQVNASYGLRQAIGDFDQPLGTDRIEDFGYVGVGIKLPLFEGGSIRAKVGEAKAQVAVTEQRLIGLELQIRLEIETALLNIKSANERIKATGKSIEQAQESLDIEREKYELGKGAIVDVLDAQSALLDSQTKYYRALADYHTSKAGLKLSVGEEQ